MHDSCRQPISESYLPYVTRNVTLYSTDRFPYTAYDWHFQSHLYAGLGQWPGFMPANSTELAITQNGVTYTSRTHNDRTCSFISRLSDDILWSLRMSCPHSINGPGPTVLACNGLETLPPPRNDVLRQKQHERVVCSLPRQRHETFNRPILCNRIIIYQ